MKHILYLLCTLLITSSCTSTTYYLVRHAEKENDTVESGLTAQGRQRGADLEKTVGTVDTVFTCTERRTVLTGLSVAWPQSKPQITVSQDSGDAITNSFVERLKKIHNRKILVVGHSNTIPTIVKKLTGETVFIGDDEFDKLFIIKQENGKFTLTQSRYGASRFATTVIDANKEINK
jgi:phosphohistidine phosphatase SixA